MIWKQLDKKLPVDKPELARALKARVMSRKLSKLICCHESEWALDYSNLEREVTAYFDKCIEQTEGATAKAAMEDQKPAKLEALKAKVISLDFWKDVKFVVKENVAAPATPVATTTATSSATQTEAETQSLVPFRTSKVYHFHPIAFVEQMKRLGTCFCDKDITVKAFELIFGKGPWFTGKLGCVDMKRDYPDVYNISTEKLVEALNNTMKKYEISSCLQKAHFLGQVGAETGFQYTAECANGDDYDPGSHRNFHNNFIKYIAFLNKYTGEDDITVRTVSSKKPAQIVKNIEIYKKAYDDYKNASSDKRTVDPIKSLKEKHDEYLTFKKEKEKFDSIYENSYKSRNYSTVYGKWRHGYRRYTSCIRNGNENDGDGKKYRGHGMLQLTWKNSYVDFKNRLNIDIVSNPELLSSDITNACNMGGSWWKKPLTGAGNLNKRADSDDMIYVTYGINGGLNGLAHRYKYTRKAVDCLGCKECGDYEHLNLGDYTYENSKIKTIKYGRENKDYIVLILKKAKKDYDAKCEE